MQVNELASAGPTIVVAIIGLLGVVVGVLISEAFRRRSRVEFYSQKLFERRLDAHEQLLALVNAGSSIAQEVMRNGELSKEDRMALISAAIGPIAEYVDEKAMLIDPLVGAHVTASLMGAEDIGDIADPVEREAARSIIWRAIRETKAMIRREAGADEIDRHFRSVARSRPSSPIIQRIKELQKDYSTGTE